MAGRHPGNLKPYQYARATEERVRRGISWLTRKNPAWVDSINLETFDNRSSYHCALGQIYQAMHIDERPGFMLARRAADFGEANRMMLYALTDLEAIEYGFECVWDSPQPTKEALALDRRWRQALIRLKGRA